MILDSHAQRGRRPAAGIAPLAAQLRRAALPLTSPADLDPLIDAIGDARFVLLGEAAHGTSEFYRWRADITKRLVREKNFSFVAVEGDWPDCYRVNRYAKWLSGAGTSAEEVLHACNRWPTWMWANREVVDLVACLRSWKRPTRIRHMGMRNGTRVSFI